MRLLILPVLLALLPLWGCGDMWVDVVWEDPPAEKGYDWEGAATYCENLDLDGKSNWRLPSINELRWLIAGCDGAETGGACSVTDECLASSCWDEEQCGGQGWSCTEGGGEGVDGCYTHPWLSGSCEGYWSSSEVEDYPDSAWGVFFGAGIVGNYEKYRGILVRCVAGGGR